MLSICATPIGNLDDVTLRVLDEIRRIPGVGDASVNGARRFSMRIWLDPSKMQARGRAGQAIVTPEDDARFHDNERGASPDRRGER